MADLQGVLERTVAAREALEVSIEDGGAEEVAAAAAAENIEPDVELETVTDLQEVLKSRQNSRRSSSEADKAEAVADDEAAAE